MATTLSTTETTAGDAPVDPELLVMLPALSQADFDSVVKRLRDALPAEELLVATPAGVSADAHAGLRVVEAPPQRSGWLLTATDFAQAQRLVAEHRARGVLLLGPACTSLGAGGLRGLAEAVLTASADLAVPNYALGPLAGLVNSAILYPLGRTLFAEPVRHPLAVDVALSARMAERLATAAQRMMALNQGDAPLWTVNEAAQAGMTVEEVEAGPRELPQPAGQDLQTILPMVAGSLFHDIEAKAAFWQRARMARAARRTMLARPQTGELADATAMVQAFKLGYTNLAELWGMVLSPNSMLGLKRLSESEGAAFRMPDALWVRVVYDFLVAYRQRTLNRSHLLGALVPLYLGWAATHLHLIAAGTDAERHVEALASTFEADKAYLVARWRWPDRFNP